MTENETIESLRQQIKELENKVDLKTMELEQKKPLNFGPEGISKEFCFNPTTKRPLGITIIAIFYWIIALSYIMFFYLFTKYVSDLRYRELISQEEADYFLSLGLINLIPAAIFFLMGFGLWKLRNIARIVMIILHSLVILLVTVQIVIGSSSPGIMQSRLFISVLIIAYLLKGSTRQVFNSSFAAIEYRALASTIFFGTINLFHYKRRSMNMLLGFFVGCALVASFFIWEYSALEFAIKDSLTDRDFEVEVQSFGDEETHHTLDSIRTWLTTEDMVEESYIVYKTIGIFGSEDFNDSHVYNPRNNTDFYVTDSDGVHFVDYGFCNRIAHQVNYEGNFTLSQNTSIISRSLVDKLEAIGIGPITVGFTLNFSFGLDNEPVAETTTLGMLERQTVSTKIISIYQRLPQLNPAKLEFNPEVLSEDTIILPRQIIGIAREKTLEQNFLIPRLFIRLDRNFVSEMDFDTLEKEIFSLRARITANFPQVYIKVYLTNIQATKQQYENAKVTMFFLLVPLILLAASFTFFAVSVVVRGRLNEMAVLRVRGARTYQIITSFIFEFLVVAFIGLLAGTYFGQAIAALIPTASEFLVFDTNSFYTRYDDLTIPSIVWIMTSIFCIATLTLPLSVQIRKFLTIDISEALGSEEAKRKSEMGIKPQESNYLRSSIFFSTILIGTFILFLFLIETGIIEQYYGTSRWLPVLFGITLIFWICFSIMAANMASSVVPAIRPVFHLLIGAPATLAVRSLKRRHAQFISLTVILTLIFSVGFFSIINGETIEDNSRRQLRYIIGSDFKIRTNTPIAFNDLFIEDIPGISKVLPVYYSFAYFSDHIVYIVGVDPILYSEIAVWDDTSFIEPKTPNNQILSQLAIGADGIIINEFLAELMVAKTGSNVALYQVNGELGLNLPFKVIGVAKSLPGFGPAKNTLIESRSGQVDAGIVVVKKDILQSYFNIQTANLFLAKAESDSNQNEITKTLRENPNVLQVFAASEVDQIHSEIYAIKILGIITVGFLVAVILGIIALTNFLAYLVTVRKQEYAIMLSFGASRKQMTHLIMVEFISIAAFAFIFGACMGIIFSWVYLQISQEFLGVEEILPIKQIIPIEVVLAACVIVAFFLIIGTYLPARKAVSCEVPMVLRSKFV